MLFKHHEENSNESIVKPANAGQVGAAPAAPAVPVVPEKDVSPAALRELLEKNLKWSQIIYEQNRKINSKLFWTAVANWLRLIFLVATFAAAAWFLPPLINNVMNQYTSLLSDPAAAVKNGSMNDIIKLLPISPDQEARIKALLQNK